MITADDVKIRFEGGPYVLMVNGDVPVTEPALTAGQQRELEDAWKNGGFLNFSDVSRYQVRQWMIVRLVSQGLAPDPDAVVDGVIDTAVSDAVMRLVLKDRWRNVVVVPRDHLLVNPVGAAMGLTPAEIDDQWAAIGAL